MVEYNVGDYLLAKDGELFRIINKYSQDIGTIFYDVKSLKPHFITYYAQDGHTIEYTQDFTTHKSVPLNRLRHLGIKIPEQRAKLVKILYG